MSVTLLAAQMRGSNSFSVRALVALLVGVLILPISTATLLVPSANAWSSTEATVTVLGGASSDVGMSIKADNQGNTYTSGSFQGTVDFDPGVEVFNLTSAGLEDVFVSKLDPSGNFLWAKRFGSSQSDIPYSIEIDNTGNVYTTGSFRSTVDFDPSEGVFNLTSLGLDDVFILKLNSSGSYEWAKRFGAGGVDWANSIEVDSSGNVYTTGFFRFTVDFDPGVGVSSLTATNADVFVSKLNSSGSFEWAKAFRGTANENGYSIAVDNSGDVYTTGFFQGTVDFDPGVGVFNLTTAGLEDVFVSKLDPSGNFLWAKRFGGTSNDYGWSMALDGAGNIYTTGFFQSTVDFDPGVEVFNLASAGAEDVFISKLDPSGDFLWAKRVGGESNDLGFSIAVDSDGSIYTTGRFKLAADFDPGEGSFNLTSSGDNDIFISKLNSLGSFEWAKRIGGTLTDSGRSMTTDSVGNVYVTGSYRDIVDFDPGDRTVNFTAREAEVFILKLNSLGETRSAPATPSDNPVSTITWDDQGATTASSGGLTSYVNGSSVAAIPTTAPQKNGHTFVGWFPSPLSGRQITNGSYTPTSPYGNVTFFAHWSVNRSSSVGTWEWTNRSSAGARDWHSFATSADGSKLFAGVDGSGSLYRSTDFGVSWSEIANTSGKNWFFIASNIDGTKVAAVDRGGDIWTSADSGLTWNARRVGGSVRDWESIASSSDGLKLVAVSSNGQSGNGSIYTSSDGGESWSIDRAPAGTNYFTGVASSNDGTRLAATSFASGIYTSSDSGQTWTSRTLPVPNVGGETNLQAVASSGDGSRLVTGSRVSGASNGGIIFTSADYGVTWKASAQANLDYINFASNGDGSRLAASIYGQSGVSTSADFGATWSFQQVGVSGNIAIASNIDGSLLFMGSYGGNLWTGKVPNSRVVAVLPSSTSANLPAAANTPATAISFSASSAAAAMTVTPIANPTTEASTPFNAAQASVFDISVTNVTGQVTICVDGGPNVRLWHFTNGAWVDVTTSQTDTQTCGVTNSFSPFATGPAVVTTDASLSASEATAATEAARIAAAEAARIAVAEAARIAAARAAADAAAAFAAADAAAAVQAVAAQLIAEMESARAEITGKLEDIKDLSVDSFAKAAIPGITSTNIAAVKAEILALPEAVRTDINQVLKVARKFEVVDNIASNSIKNLPSSLFVEIGLIPATSKNKVTLIAAIRKLPASARDTYAEIKAAIDAETAKIKARSERAAAIAARNKARFTKK